MQASNPRFQMRQIIPKSDLHAVADLIEQCFRDTMDSDGRDYLRHLRRVADEENLSSWFQNSSQVNYPRVDGFVWEEDGRIIGNLTLIPAIRDGKRVYLIANVAVQPDHRGKGIGRKLTERALLAIRERHGLEAWLHVRADNPVAYGLYLSLGFTEKARRTTWVRESEYAFAMDEDPGFILGRRNRQNWVQQKEWLRKIYPEEIRWNLPYREDLFLPGAWQSFSRLINGEVVEHWIVKKDDELCGMLTWQPTRHHFDLIWLSLDLKNDKRCLPGLLALTSKLPVPRKALSINFPSGIGVQAFIENEFINQADLIWMKMDCS